MVILSMETQTDMKMGHGEIQENRTDKPMDENTEEQFLKDLYLFMKKRDTPIERIPHLGFKQIDLFVMYKTVKDLGGYHQVTSQQLWKQVYNTLGGNPRSTSAATCTRRHYEKLLLPYECHIKGLLINLPSQPKHIQYINFRKEDHGPRPAKRKPLPLPLHQSPPDLQSDQHLSSFSLNPSYHNLFYPPYTVPAPYGPIPPTMLTPHTPPAPQPFLPCPPALMSLSDRIADPLEHLRFLAKQYESSSGLTEPLNLSVKASSSTNINSNPASSFSPLSSSKNPKFLNKPSPLYTTQHPAVERNAVCEMEDGGAALEVTPLSETLKDKEGGLKAPASEDPPSYDSAPTPTNTGISTFPLKNNEVTIDVVRKNSSPKTDFYWSTEERDGSPEVQEIAGRNGGRIEIEIPLPMLDHWLKLCGPRATLHRPRQLLSQDEQPGQRSSSKPEAFPINLQTPREANVHPLAKDLRLSQRNTTNPALPTQASTDHHTTNQCNFTSYRSLPSGGIQKNAASRDVYQLDQWDNNAPYSPKPTNCWETYDRGIQALPVQKKIDSSPLTAQPDFAASKSYNEVADQGREERPNMAPPAVLMLNSSSTPLLHLTTEEVMKLKKIISSTL